ncbi:N-succinyl-L-Arg/Lys racemase [Asticcacaulis sp. MM231]|uniref:mandelate racemase/muconate lactonizing enzyme family protein n=1 Tax=Asticcacaulis sp. MM231 TaxID=3157666 RepID=UPI0032D5A030
MDAQVIQVEIPFKTAFSHASARRKVSSAVVVRLRDADGLCGYGEGCPREYVTGETMASAVTWLKARIGPWSQTVSNLDDLRRLCQRHEADINLNPSAFCAFELAMIDLMARRAGLGIEAFLGLSKLSRPLEVTAVSGSDNPLIFQLQSWRFKAAGMRSAKLKVGANQRRNVKRVKHLAKFARVRLDGNNLWTDASEAVAALKPLQANTWAVEEPIKARDFAGMGRIHNDTGLKVILDESLLNRYDLAAFLAVKPDPQAYIVNVRISKMGGLLRSLDLVRHLRELGFGLVLGSQVGETSCLTRAALALAPEMFPLLGFEGGYGRHLLVHDAFSPSLTFDSQAKLHLDHIPPQANGLGITPTKALAFSDGNQPR